ncbi:hypothetical protein ID866_7804 [Astraeus odoratus]|nr:hypothetical protein ID866_7804 [Astraeus odoratus]
MSIAPPLDGTSIIPDSSDKAVKAFELIDHGERSHALYDPHQVVHTLPYKDCGSAKLHEDGWIRGCNDALLLWIPPALQKPFYSRHTILVIPKGGCPELDLSKMIHGMEWQTCFKGTS